MIKIKPINVSNTTLSTYKGNRHRKFDTKQAKRHDFGTAHCAVCDKVFTKNHWNTKYCSEECKRERENAYARKYREENRKDPEWVERLNASGRKYHEKNREKRNAQRRKYYEKNREKINAKNRKYREKNREKINAIHRKYYEENREKIKAQQRARYHANKEK